LSTLVPQCTIENACFSTVFQKISKSSFLVAAKVTATEMQLGRMPQYTIERRFWDTVLLWPLLVTKGHVVALSPLPPLGWGREWKEKGKKTGGLG